MAVILETSLGNLTVDLFTDERPICCKNFLKLCKVKYYNFCLFHSVQRNLVAQTGDPTGTGKGGQSVYGQIYGEQAKYFEMEVSPRIKHTKPGLVSMVNNGNNMHGSQFFVTLGENLDYLDGKHTVFGEVSEGLDILMQINEAYCDDEHRPYKDIRIYHTIILDDPYDDPDGLEVPDRSPEPTKEQLATVRIGADEEIDDFKGMSEEQVTEIMEDKEAKANAQILEMIGDIPDADIRPPDNVLFVCKLNPVTTDEDLEIIFSRFGKITSCEVIKDHKTGESLQYAFIEFEKEEDCEKAFFKMDNVLIDDRRIHVDFSQSVSKVKWKGKGKGVVHMQEEEAKPKYRLKDTTRRKDDNYELVFDEEDSSNKSKKSKKKKKKHKYSDSDSEEERSSKSHSKYEKGTKRKEKDRLRSQSPQRNFSRKSRSRSPVKRRHKEGSRSPEYRKKRSRSPEYRKKKDRSRSPIDSYRDRHSNRDPHKDKTSHRDKYRERSRSPSEKHYHSDKKSHKDKYRERDRR